MFLWTFWDFYSERGENQILTWLNGIPKEAKAKINTRLLTLQGFPVFPEQYISAYKTWDDLYELRIISSGVQYRPFGMYLPNRAYVLLAGGIEKGKVPKTLLEVANERRKIVTADRSRVRPHDFS